MTGKMQKLGAILENKIDVDRGSLIVWLMCNLSRT
jgi:hypothetical protein